MVVCCHTTALSVSLSSVSCVHLSLNCVYAGGQRLHGESSLNSAVLTHIHVWVVFHLTLTGALACAKNQCVQSGVDTNVDYYLPHKGVSVTQYVTPSSCVNVFLQPSSQMEANEYGHFPQCRGLRREFLAQRSLTSPAIKSTQYWTASSGRRPSGDAQEQWAEMRRAQQPVGPSTPLYGRTPALFLKCHQLKGAKTPTPGFCVTNNSFGESAGL